MHFKMAALICTVSSQAAELLAGAASPPTATVTRKSEIILSFLSPCHISKGWRRVPVPSVNTELWPHADLGSQKFRHTCHLSHFTPKDDDERW